MGRQPCMFDFENEDFFEIKDNFEKYQNIPSVLLYGDRRESCQVSIMIPTYLRNRFLTDTIDSALAQKTDIPYEIVVVDNNDDTSDTETLSLLKQYDPKKVCYYKNEKNLGMFGNWNRCIELAHAEWILILHDDDIIEKNYIDEMQKVVTKYPEAICIGCDHRTIDINGNITEHKKSVLYQIFTKVGANKKFEVQMTDMYHTHPIDIMGCFFKREAAINAGGFDEKWYPVSDYIFLLNLVARGQVWQVEKPLFQYRIAVNISYRIDHVIGCLEADISMRKCINERYGLKNGRKDIQFRSRLEKEKEICAYSCFGTKLSQEEKETVRLELKKYKAYCGLKKVSKREFMLFTWLSRWYLFRMRCLRAKR